jgi:hypothetical protein
MPRASALSLELPLSGRYASVYCREPFMYIRALDKYTSETARSPPFRIRFQLEYEAFGKHTSQETRIWLWRRTKSMIKKNSLRHLQTQSSSYSCPLNRR